MDMMRILFCLIITDVILWWVVLTVGLMGNIKSDNSATEFDDGMIKTLLATVLAVAKGLSFLTLLVMVFISIRSLVMV